MTIPGLPCWKCGAAGGCEHRDAPVPVDATKPQREPAHYQPDLMFKPLPNGAYQGYNFRTRKFKKG